MPALYQRKHIRVARRVGMAMAAVAVLCGASVSAPASSAAAAPTLRVTVAAPDFITPSVPFVVYVNALNMGSAPLSGNVTARYTLPAGTVVREVVQERQGLPETQCELTGPVEECVTDATGLQAGAMLRLKLVAVVPAGATGTLSSRVEVFGGGVPGVFSEPLSLSTEPIGPFAVKSLGIDMSDAEGEAAVGAGGDPADLLTTLSFPAAGVETYPSGLFPFPAHWTTAPAENPRDVIVHLPAGFVGNPLATPVRCTPSQLTTSYSAFVSEIPACPLASQVGVVRLYANGDLIPLFNVQPPAGSPAELGFLYQGIVIPLIAKLRPADNGIDIVTADASSSIPLPKFEVTVWGTPGAVEHNSLRGGVCLSGGQGYNPKTTGANETADCSLPEASQKPFLRLPTSCSGQPLPWSVDVDTYQHPGTFVHGETTTPALTGCETVPFAPNLALVPSTLAPHSSSGADVTLTLPQNGLSSGIEESDLKSVTVVLPAGVNLNPASANGLQACTDAQLRFKEEGAAQCPGASKIGSLTLRTRLLDHEIGGSIFVLSQKSQDPASGELFRVAIEVRSDSDGVDIKLPGMIKVDPNTGQITTVFEDLPQLPFESMTLHFEGAAHPVLVTPQACGTYDTSAVLTGWSGKSVQERAPFTIDQECGPRGFAPGFTAGAQNPVAGAFTSFALQVTRSDNDQEIASLSPVTLPPGLLADIGSVPHCTDAQVAAAACPESSRLGNVTVGAGVGATPVYINTGNVYLTGPYKGAPFGLAFIVHVQAGAYDLGMEVVRAALQIDPHTAQASVLTDPLPLIVKGVPVRIRDIRVSIDRPHFMIEPTSCDTLKVTGAATSTEGATAPLSSRFQVGECEKLPFKPVFKAATAAKVSRNGGASLSVTVAVPKGPQANIRSVKVKLPRQLAARLTTLQQACADTTFDANPASCPPGSIVGHARALTPILAAPLTGPAYFVSHGGAKFPELVLVLQGEGVTIDLAGETEISEKTSITSSTFRSLPDAPVSSFELTLPTGPHSALGSPANLCKSKLLMPTSITGQNGALLKQSTKIAVSGCARHPKKRSPARKRRHK